MIIVVDIEFDMCKLVYTYLEFIHTAHAHLLDVRLDAPHFSLHCGFSHS